MTVMGCFPNKRDDDRFVVVRLEYNEEAKFIGSSRVLGPKDVVG